MTGRRGQGIRDRLAGPGRPVRSAWTEKERTEWPKTEQQEGTPETKQPRQENSG
jgi:hypothetical protein